MSRDGEKTTEDAFRDLTVVRTSGALALLATLFDCVGLVGAVCVDDMSAADAGCGTGGEDCSSSGDLEPGWLGLSTHGYQYACSDIPDFIQEECGGNLAITSDVDSG